jgi:pilus assembly protein CpaB
MARPSTEGETTSIVVAKREILKGDLIKPDDIRLQEWRKDALPEGAIEKIEDLQDKRVRNTIIVGEPLLAGKLLEGKDGGPEIPAGMKAVTVKIDNSSYAGLVKPGDNVDVLVHVVADTQRGIMATTTKQLLSNIKVLAVDDLIERPTAGEPSVQAKTVSLLVSPKDAMRVNFAQEVGKILLVMRSMKDHAESDAGQGDDKVDITDIIGGSSTSSASSKPAPTGSALAAAGITPLPPVEKEESVTDTIGKQFSGLKDLLDEMKNARENGPPPEKKTWKLLLIEGSEAKEVEFAAGSRLPRPVAGGPAFDSSSSSGPGSSEASASDAPPLDLGIQPKEPVLPPAGDQIDRIPDAVN